MLDTPAHTNISEATSPNPPDVLVDCIPDAAPWSTSSTYSSHRGPLLAPLIEGALPQLGAKLHGQLVKVLRVEPRDGYDASFHVTMEALPETCPAEHAEPRPGAAHWHAALTSSDPVGEPASLRFRMSSLDEMMSRAHALPEDVLNELMSSRGPDHNLTITALQNVAAVTKALCWDAMGAGWRHRKPG